jgi:hypothetical protein
MHQLALPAAQIAQKVRISLGGCAEASPKVGARHD